MEQYLISNLYNQMSSLCILFSFISKSNFLPWRPPRLCGARDGDEALVGHDQQPQAACRTLASPSAYPRYRVQLRFNFNSINQM